MTNPLANQLNQQIQKENLVVYELLSDFGKEIYYPKGILSQSAEAKEKAHRFNATLGIATNSNGPLSLPSFDSYFNNLQKNEIYNYSPSFGQSALRQVWKEKLIKDNFDLSSQSISTPVVTAGLTAGLSLASELFFEKKDTLILPNQIWGNYRLLFQVRRGVQIKTYEFFSKNGFNLVAFDALLSEEVKNKKVAKILFNFPNNPTGYSLTKEEVLAIKDILLKHLNNGIKILIILDDAYYGLFFEDNIPTESIFNHLANLHSNLVTIKIDGMTKEYFAWGFRVGFITFGNKDLAQSYEALEKKAAGAIRANSSNCSTVAQSILLKSLREREESISREAKNNLQILKDRGNEVKRVLKDPKFSAELEPYPFNSGYFMLVKLKNVSADKLRIHLLSEYGVGTISTAPSDLRVAFSCVEKKDIAELFDLILAGCKDLRKKIS